MKLLLTALLLAEVAVPEPPGRVHAELDILATCPDRIPRLLSP